jgi:hypothetical protein
VTIGWIPEKMSFLANGNGVPTGTGNTPSIQSPTRKVPKQARSASFAVDPGFMDPQIAVALSVTRLTLAAVILHMVSELQ